MRSRLPVRTHLVRAHDTNQRVEAISLRPEVLDEKVAIRWFLHHGMIVLGKLIPTPVDLLGHAVTCDMATFCRQLSRADVSMVLRGKPSGKVFLVIGLEVMCHRGRSAADAAEPTDLDNVPCPLVDGVERDKKRME